MCCEKANLQGVSTTIPIRSWRSGVTDQCHSSLFLGCLFRISVLPGSIAPSSCGDELEHRNHRVYCVWGVATLFFRRQACISRTCGVRETDILLKWQALVDGYFGNMLRQRIHKNRTGERRLHRLFRNFPFLQFVAHLQMSCLLQRFCLSDSDCSTPSTRLINGCNCSIRLGAIGKFNKAITRVLA